MQKSLIAAALVGAATAAGNFNHQITPSSWDAYYKLTFNVDYDAGYTTTYAGTDGTSQTKNYGLEIYSYVDITVKHEFFETYYNQYMFSFIPVEYTPYTQSVSYYRPEAEMGQSVEAYGTSEITLLKFYTTYTENAKTCGASFVDAAMNMDMADLAPVCAYDETKATSYVDTYWAYEPLSSESWYGLAQYWTQNLYSKSA